MSSQVESGETDELESLEKFEGLNYEDLAILHAAHQGIRQSDLVDKLDMSQGWISNRFGEIKQEFDLPDDSWRNWEFPGGQIPDELEDKRTGEFGLKIAERVANQNAEIIRQKNISEQDRTEAYDIASFINHNFPDILNIDFSNPQLEVASEDQIALQKNLVEAIKDRYEDKEDGIDRYDVSESDIEEIVEAFEFSLEEENQGLEIEGSIENAVENVQKALAEMIRGNGNKDVLPESIGLQDVLDREELVMHHLENSDGVSTQEKIAEKYGWDKDRARDAIIEAMKSYDIRRVPEDNGFEVFISGRRERKNSNVGLSNKSNEVEEVQKPSERFTSESEEDNPEERKNEFDENVLERDSVENDDVSKLLTLLDGNKGEISSDHAEEFYDDSEDVKDAISKARELGFDIVWKKTGTGFTVRNREYEESSKREVQGKGLWEQMRNGREIPSEEIQPDDIMPNGNYEYRHVSDGRKEKVIDCLENYHDDRMTVSELENRLDGMGSSKTRKVIAYLIDKGHIEMNGDEIVYQRGEGNYFIDW